MPIYVESYAPFAAPIESVSSADWLSEMQPVVTNDLQAIDGCQVLGRTKIFLVDQGVPATLQHVMRDRQGRVVDLTTYMSPAVSDSVSDSSSDSDASSDLGAVVLRVKKILGTTVNAVRNPVWEIQGDFYEPSSGLVRAVLVPTIVEHPGIYELSWGVKDSAGIVVFVNASLLAVEKTLFAQHKTTVYKGQGPPTISEIRMAIMDSSPAENLLLDDVEFGADQIVQAIVDPVREWNETPPPIETHTTHTFPYRNEWKKAIVGHLMRVAAANYRRNRMQHSAGGVEIDDKNKEREYLAEANQRLAEWKNFLTERKFANNLRRFGGSFGSQYGRH